jgi:hypothetical protein
MESRRILLLSALLFTTLFINAQEVLPVDSLVKNLRLDFAVPDLPAFNGLEREEGNLLRPSTPKDFSIVANEFFNGFNIIIPKIIAIEVAPITLIRYNKLTLQDYQRNPILYNSRISAGTYRDSSNLSQMSLGYRTTLINKGDIKSDKNLKELMVHLRNINRTRNEFYDSELERLGITEFEFATDTVLQKQLEDSFNQISSYRDSLQSLLMDYRENKYWNAEKLDIAFCIVGSSPDSAARNIQYNSLWFWTTYARPVGENGQLMWGINTTFFKEDGSKYTNIGIPARFYFGTNMLKGFIEGQYQYKQKAETNNLIMKLGCEYNLYKSLWFNFSAGIYKDLTNNTSDFISTFKLAYAIPGSL